MKVLLVSGYELGHQPYHLALPAADLLADGHSVECLDLAVQRFGPEAAGGVDAVAISVPMHTAARIGVEFARGIRQRFPDLPLAFYGLYAHVAVDAFVDRYGSEREGLRPAPVYGLAGEYRRALRRWVSDPTSRPDGSNGAGFSGAKSQGAETEAAETNRGRTAGLVTLSLERQSSHLPARHLLPPLDRYARLAVNGEERLAGYLEATSGCSHRCKHCPVPIVYAGRMRKTAIESLLQDVEQLVDAGARHITFGDPDFLNAPGFAVELVREFHGAYPDLTFDCTAKVEHILRYRHLWKEFAGAGLLFVVSAFETTNARVLRILDKGHGPEDFPEAVGIIRSAAVEIRPSFLPFTPWTRPEDLFDILELCIDLDLVANVDPVQYSLKLLVPKGSLLLGNEEMRAAVGDYDTEAMSFRWTSQCPETVELQRKLAEIASAAESNGPSLSETVEAMAKEIYRAGSSGRGAEAEFVERAVSAADEAKVRARPRLTESWFCCAEPTPSQLQGIDGAAQACAC